jgi:hypothetical protein
VFFTDTGAPVTRCVRIDGHLIGDGGIGPGTRSVSAFYFAIAWYQVATQSSTARSAVKDPTPTRPFVAGVPYVAMTTVDARPPYRCGRSP